ncbi:MAG TPA: sigma factor-like helix-turn-helix DNA-binding protein [Patescibacteria group bacterium]|nr:sigma factor-like helix-turn-helix DNA-binding protein [Patescibacteria group bacterium]
MSRYIENLLKQKKQEELAKLDSVLIVNSIFSGLKDREKDVLKRRYGLYGKKKETLESIGGLHKLTRERVRQIETASLAKLRKLDFLDEYIKDIKQSVSELLREHGGLMKQDFMLDILIIALQELRKKDLSEKERNLYKEHFDFIISKLFPENIVKYLNHDNYHVSYSLKDVSDKHFDELTSEAVSKVKSMRQTVKTQELLEILKGLKAYKKYSDELDVKNGADLSKIFKDNVFPEDSNLINSNKILYNFIQTIKHLDQNKFGDWGLSDSKEVKPKTINDKIYLVLKYNKEKPMHFTEIAERINEVAFDKKKANAATVHNELILDDRYKLVGRGLYALKEW